MLRKWTGNFKSVSITRRLALWETCADVYVVCHIFKFFVRENTSTHCCSATALLAKESRPHPTPSLPSPDRWTRWRTKQHWVQLKAKQNTALWPYLTSASRWCCSDRAAAASAQPGSSSPTPAFRGDSPPAMPAPRRALDAPSAPLEASQPPAPQKNMPRNMNFAWIFTEAAGKMNNISMTSCDTKTLQYLF